MANKPKPTYPQSIKKIRKESIKYRTKTHLLDILLVCVILFNIYITKNSNNYNFLTAIVENQPMRKLSNNSIYTSNRKSKFNQPYKNHNIVLLLLILSNDIDPNPGPVSTTTTEKCSICKSQIDNEIEHLQCSTCKKYYHLNCQQILPSKLKTGTYEWICSSKQCPPIHQNVFKKQNITTKNKYSVLSETEPQHTALNMSYQIETLTLSDIINGELLQELTTISPEEYAGKYLCRVCCKEVKDNHRAISCDACDTWSHLKCSDVSIKLYNHLTHLSNFKWTCTKCRDNEEPITEKIDIEKLKTTELPDKYSVIKPDNKELIIIHMNCRSVVNKREELENIIQETDADIICLTETWMDDSIPKQAFLPDGYKIIRKDRHNDFKQKYGKNRGGGVAVLYKEQLNVEKKDYLTEDLDEILWVQVKIKESFMLGVIYRAEYTDLLAENADETTIEKNIRKANELSNRIIVCGDFNIDVSNPENKMTQILNNIYQSYGLSQLIDKPTRFDKKSGKTTTLDHFWLNENELHNVVKMGTFIGISDHLGTYLKLKKHKSIVNLKKIKFRDYKKYNQEEFNENLQTAIISSSIQEKIDNKDLNSAIEEFLSVMQNSINLFAPIIEIQRIKKTKLIPWFTKELRELITTKNNMLQDSFIYGYSMFKTQIKQLTNNINHLKRKLKKNFLTENLKLAEKDSRKCWDVINTVADRKQSQTKTEPDMMNQAKADSFNKYFANVGKEIQKELNLNIESINFTGLKGFDFQNESIESVLKIINSLKTNTATGYDEISAKILKDASHTIAPIICKIINLGYEIHQFPTCMKKATISALHKKKDVNLISNYRPISILPTLSKVIEKSATNQLVTYLEQTNIINSNQHAYRKRHGTVTCLAEVVDYLYQLLDENTHAAIISLDLSKAFDSISHQLLLNKLSMQGLSEKSILWIQSYLTERKQVTKFKDYTSTEELITAGVPQGSIIGPLLFLCFTNDLYEAFDETCKILSYADDTQIIVKADSANDLKCKIRNTILKAQKWYTNNSMKNNIEKTEILIINSKKSKLKNTVFKFNDNGTKKKIKPSRSIEVLGIILDENLNWSSHTNKVKRDAFNTIRQLHRINHLLPIELRIQLYNTLVTPILDYADIIWGGCGAVNSKKVQIAQNFAIRSITGSKKHDSATESFKKLKFLNLQQRRLVHEAVFTNKSLLHLNPTNISLRYYDQCSTGNKNTRNNSSGVLNLPHHKTAKYQQSPFYRCIAAWNSCPSTIPTHNPRSFKKSFQKHIINSTFKN